MRAVAAAVAVTSLIGGAAGASLVFRDAAGRTPASVAAAPGPTAAPTRTVVRLLDCRSGWTLKRGVCVRVIVRKVVDPAPPPPVGQPDVVAAATLTRRVEHHSAHPSRGGSQQGSSHGPASADEDDHGDDHGDEHADSEDSEHGEDHDEDHGEDHDDEPEGQLDD